MKIQLNTDKNIKGTEGLEAFVSEKLLGSFKHLSHYVTRIEVHLSDQNGEKGGADDIQCKMEARIENRKPVTVVSKSDTKEKALDAATGKLKSALSTIVGKMKER